MTNSPEEVNTQEMLEKFTQEADLNGDMNKIKETFSTPEKTMKLFLENTNIKERISLLIEKIANRGRFAKSNEISKQYRLEGNKIFSGPNPKLSLRYFSLAIKYANPRSEELRLAFGNRSAILFLMEEFEKCLVDIEHALLEEHNNERKIKLFLRKARCLLGLNKVSEATKVFQMGQDVIKGSNENDITPRIRNMKKEIESDLEKIEGGVNLMQRFNDRSEKNQLPTPSHGVNPQFPFASMALTVKEDPLKGRHVVARRRLQKGDVLFVEKPFAFVVLPICSLTNCHYCCEKIINPIPCEKCAEGSFCDAKCRREAWESYHKWECGSGLDLCYSLGIAHLGLRLAIVGRTSGKDSRYILVQQLISHLENLNAPDLYQYTATAAILAVYLKTSTDFFEVHPECNVESFGGVILEHIAQLVCNGHAITGLWEGLDEGRDVYSEEQIRIATAIFPSASMMNHSCNSNIMNSFNGQYLIVKASRNIPEGGEVYNCYGPHFRRMAWEERQNRLREQYKFTCNCDPCSNPSQKAFQQKFQAYLCNCGGPVLLSDPALTKYACLECNTEYSAEHIEKSKSVLVRADNLMESGERAMERENVTRALDKYSKALTLKEDNMYKHHTEIRDCKNKMAKCYAILGMYEESFELVEDGLFGDLEQFGECSSEMIYQVMKMTDIAAKICETPQLTMKRRLVVKKTLRYMAKAKDAVDILFGKWNSNYKELIGRELLFRRWLIDG